MKKKNVRIGLACALLLPLTIAFTSCYHYIGRVFLSGSIVTEDIPINNIDDVSVHSAITLFLQEGPTESLRVEIDENLKPHLLVRRDRNKLELRLSNGVTFSGRGVTVYMTYKDLREIDAEGASEIIFTDTVSHFEDLKVEASGASRIEAQVLYAKQRLRIDLSGASKCLAVVDADRAEYDLSGASSFEGASFSRVGYIELSGASKWEGYGECRDLEVDAEGASSVADYDLTIEKLSVDLSGASRMSCTVLTSAYVEASGASNFYYKGDPAVLREVKLSGGSKVYNR